MSGDWARTGQQQQQLRGQCWVCYGMVIVAGGALEVSYSKIHEALGIWPASRERLTSHILWS